jgi:hypothetical protein
LESFLLYFSLSLAMCLCVASLWVISLCKVAAMSDIESDKFIQEKQGRDIGLWKVTLHSKKGEMLMTKEGQYLNDMLDLVKEIVTSEDYSTDKHYVTVTFD